VLTVLCACQQAGDTETVPVFSGTETSQLEAVRACVRVTLCACHIVVVTGACHAHNSRAV
jgi:hypothetical protein